MLALDAEAGKILADTVNRTAVPIRKARVRRKSVRVVSLGRTSR